MSETEFNKGKLVRMDLSGSLEDKCKAAVLELNLDFNPKYYQTYQECVEDEGYRKLYIHNDNLYKVKYEQMDDNDDIFEAELIRDGVIKFTTKYYNSGCSFNEALDIAVKNIL